MANTKSLNHLLRRIRACRHCEADLPLGPRPILEASCKSRVLIIGQAPSRRVHEHGTAWDDPSGDRLRDWMGLDREDFYNTSLVAIVPMGYCYPGTGKSGDLPPRPECASLWHNEIMSQLGDVKLTLLVGAYAQKYVLGQSNKASLTKTVAAWRDYRPQYFPLPHPSPRNNRWIANNPWFEQSTLPCMRRCIERIKAE